MRVNLGNFSISFTDGCRKCSVSGFGTVSSPYTGLVIKPPTNYMDASYVIYFNFKKEPFRRDFKLEFTKGQLFHLDMSQDERTKLATEIKIHVKEHILKAIQKQLESVKFD